MSLSYFIATIVLFFVFAFFTTFVKKSDLSFYNITFSLTFITLIGFGITNSHSETDSLYYWIFALCYPAMAIIALCKIKFERTIKNNETDEE